MVLVIFYLSETWREKKRVGPEEGSIILLKLQNFHSLTLRSARIASDFLFCFPFSLVQTELLMMEEGRAALGTEVYSPPPSQAWALLSPDVVSHGSRCLQLICELSSFSGFLPLS